MMEPLLTPIITIRNEELGIPVSLFPNPNNGNFIIQFDSRDNRSIQVLDATGRLIYDQEFQDRKSAEILLGNVSEGVYTIRILSGSEIHNMKMMVTEK
ncbi:MAG: T9SS type A sorting domain-containing protein [Bacteroidetes bacterium]|nr:T9SS type A sorting domain-containing protein [Bacteroidota bacterium]